jgi:hypothetical protein
MPIIAPSRNVFSGFTALGCMLLVVVGLVFGVAWTDDSARGEPADDALADAFTKSVRPFLKANCLSCHANQEPEAELDLSTYTSLDDVAGALGTWELILERLTSGEMPPEDAERQPSAKERQAAIDWIKALRKREGERTAGDPGRVLARRLSNAEFNYTVRDLTGVDIQPAKEFPVDPANEAGFDNTGDSLTMTPALLRKYLDAARSIAAHLVLKPEGFTFASHPAVTDTDRDKYCVRRIIDFYQRQRTDYADYFQAAWRYKHRVALGKPETTLTQIADDEELSAKYLDAIWQLLSDDDHSHGPLARLQTLWQGLPPPEPGEPAALRSGCEAMRDYVTELRAKLSKRFDRLRVRGMHAGSQPLVLWRNRQHATHRMTLNRDALVVEGEPIAQVNRTQNEDDESDEEDIDEAEKASDPDLLLPADADKRAPSIAAFERFCAVFPDKFYVSERGREFLDRSEKETRNEQGRLLSAGFHSMMGYFRDDAPLYELVLDEAQQRELDVLWKELDFIANAPVRQHTGFIWFERTDSRFMISEEFDFARAEDKDAASEAKIQRLAEVYLAKAQKNRAGDVELAAIRDHFANVNASVRWVENARLAAEPMHLEALVQFAERAYRRPIVPQEREELLSFYRELRDEHGLDHEDALRDTVASVLVSPRFLYRVDSLGTSDGVEPLPDYALASRLSYFLWSSLPDEKLLEAAASGELHHPETLLAHTRRMLRHDRAWGLATEFGGNWLDFRRFQEHNSVDRERFPNFDDELRQSMFEEPLRFFVDLLREDRSILDFLGAKHTYVNAPLARHYGMTEVKPAPGQWVRVDDASKYHRGGLLPMAVFLTKNSPGLRTSPVQRGYWVVRRLLGERIPPPPPTVPELPNDEAKLGELTLREVLARHREDKSCAGCHVRFDGIGLAYEGFGPVGERRTVDLGGRPVDVHAAFPGGAEGSDVAGLRDYLRAERQDEFVDNFCRKLLSYGLGRALTPSDDATIADMRANLKENDYRVSGAIETIVLSPQFLTRRGRETSREER